MYTIVLTINATEYDISNEVIEDSLKLDFSLYNDDLKPTTNKVSFELGRVSSVIPILLASTGDIPISIKLSATDIFTGYLTDNYKASIQYARFDNVKISAEDYTIKKLKTAWISTDTVKTLWLDTAICNPAAPSASLIHLICALAGVTVSTSYAIDSTASITVIDEDKKTYFDVLEKLLFEMGYVPHFNGSGQLELYQLYKTTPTAAHTLTTSTYLVGEIDIEKELQQYDESRIKWREIETLSDVIISNDTTGAAGIYDCVIPVSPETYYPSNTDSEAPTYIDYSLESGKEIVYVSAATTDIVTDDGVTSSFTNLGTKGLISLFNSNPSVIKNIYRLKITADTLKAIKADRITLSNLTAGASQKYIEYDAEYIHLATDANRLSNILAYYYTYADYTYTFKSYTEYDLGEIVTLQDTATGLNVLVAITDKTLQMNKPIIYKSVGVGDFTIDAATVDSGTYDINTNPIVQIGTEIEAINETVSEMPTYEEILSGFNDTPSGGTTTPDAPIISGNSLFRTAYLVWDKQAYLTGNVLHEIYRSTDNTNFTLINTIGADTQYQDATMALGGTEDTPTGITYYYKIKRKSRATASGFSNTLTFTSAPIPAADIAANAITASKISTAVLNALIANINQYLTVSSDLGFLAGSETGSASGDIRAYLDEDEIAIQEYNGTEWKNITSIVASGAAGQRFSELVFGKNNTTKIQYKTSEDFGKLVNMAMPCQYTGNYTYSGTLATEANNVPFASGYVISSMDSVILPDGNTLIGMMVTYASGSERYLYSYKYDAVANTFSDLVLIGDITAIASYLTNVTMVEMGDGNICLWNNYVYSVYDVINDTWNEPTAIEQPTGFPNQNWAVIQEIDGSFSHLGTVVDFDNSCYHLIHFKVSSKFEIVGEAIELETISAALGWGNFAASSITMIRDSVGDITAFCGTNPTADSATLWSFKRTNGTWIETLSSVTTKPDKLTFAPRASIMLDGRILLTYLDDYDGHFINRRIIETNGTVGAASQVNTTYSGLSNLRNAVTTYATNGKTIYLWMNNETIYYKLDASDLAGDLPIGKIYKPMDDWGVSLDDNENHLLTTPFSDRKISMIQNHISTSAPTSGDGNNGDIWFRV